MVKARIKGGISCRYLSKLWCWVNKGSGRSTRALLRILQRLKGEMQRLSALGKPRKHSFWWTVLLATALCISIFVLGSLNLFPVKKKLESLRSRLVCREAENGLEVDTEFSKIILFLLTSPLLWCPYPTEDLLHTRSAPYYWVPLSMSKIIFYWSRSHL